jgi:hypothetical protein
MNDLPRDLARQRTPWGPQLTIAGDTPWKIVGVVKGMEYETDPTVANSNQVFIPSETPGSFFSTFVARVDGRAEDHLAAIRDTIQSADPQVPVFGGKTMEQRLDEIFARPKFYRTAVWIFSGFALLLAAIGIYGTVSYAVIQRTQEMGVRMALGTTPARLRGMLLRQGLLMVAAGAIPGISRSAIDRAFSGNADRWSEVRRHDRVRWLGYVPRANRVGQHLGRLAADRHTRYRCHPARLLVDRDPCCGQATPSSALRKATKCFQTK